MDKVAKKRNPGKDHIDKPLSKKAKREKFPMDLGKGDKPALKSAAKGEENKQSSEQRSVKNAPTKDKGHQKSLEKPEDRVKHIQKAPINLEKKEKREKTEETKKHKPKEKPQTDGQSERMRQLSKAAVVKGDVSDTKLSNSLDSEENDPAYEYKEVNHDDDQIEAEEKVAIHETVKPACKKNKLLDRGKFSVIAFNMYVARGVPFGGREIIGITKSSTDEEYDEVHAAWLKE
ncbi:hypothetical protein Cgig2_018525 [Carnegiea gigantea]|uniref:Uncharacterized protein n=1 Tax=Carnegiea gigantea TaxID=171969 RepID=A0A9Q1GW79_9CARY|nr:hypothetical protein Cgig2_018525 [Carnegiea gigantea]